MIKKNILNYHYLKYLKFNKLFNDKTPATTNQNPPSQAPPKSKEELKVEKLMEQWPEFIRNPKPGMIDLVEKKKELEQMYKFHQGDKNYLKEWDLPDKMSEDIGSLMTGVLSTDNIIENFKKYEGFITDDIIIDKFYRICTEHKDLTPEFYSYLIPLIKKLISKADRHSNKFIAKACISAANINLGDKEFWDILVIFINKGIQTYQ